MRDDIHRRAPVGAFWKQAIKACYTTASFSEDGAAAAERAIVEDVRRELDPRFVQDLAEGWGASQGELFGLGEVVKEPGPEQTGPLESQVLTHLAGQLLMQEPGSPAAACARAVEAAMRGRVESQLRNLDAYLCAEFPKDRRLMMSRLRGAFAAVPFARHAAEIVNGNMPATGRRARVLEVDGDLRG